MGTSVLANTLGRITNRLFWKFLSINVQLIKSSCIIISFSAAHESDLANTDNCNTAIDNIAVG